MSVFVNSSCLCEHSTAEAAAALGGTDMVPFYTLLKGGKDDDFYRVSETIPKGEIKMHIFAE